MTEARIVSGVWSESAGFTGRPDWQADADCHGLTDLFFYAAVGRKAGDKNAEALSVARQVCADCRVREQCLRYAIDNDEQYGIWGGLTTRERNIVAASSRSHREGTIADLRTLRKKRRLHQWQLAEMLGVSQTTVAHWESGKARPNAAAQELICELFGLDIRESA